MRKLSLQELDRLTVEQFHSRPKMPLVLVLDNVRSALNVGSAFRTADAFALEEIILCGITARPPHREITKTAIGATESMTWRYEQDPVRVVRQLKDQGYEIWAVEQAEGSTSLAEWQVDPDKKYALVFGNEVSGVSDVVMTEVEGALEVPQFGTKHSLNISVCIGVVIWEVCRQLGFPAG